MQTQNVEQNDDWGDETQNQNQIYTGDEYGDRNSNHTTQSQNKSQTQANKATERPTNELEDDSDNPPAAQSTNNTEQKKRKRKNKKRRNRNKNKKNTNVNVDANANANDNNNNDASADLKVDKLSQTMNNLSVSHPVSVKPAKSSQSRNNNSKPQADQKAGKPPSNIEAKQTKQKQTKQTNKAKETKQTKQSKQSKQTKSKTEQKSKSKAKANELAEKPKAKKVKKVIKSSKKPPWTVHDSRDHLNMVLIGHVDAGKSTISGQILLQTGQIDERTIQKYRREAKEKNRESWWIAYIMDEDEEERQKGKTVECGRAHFDTKTKRYTILDAPGHKNYVPNMISGASQADLALLVVSARKGEFEAGFNRGGQTREHGLLALTLGISRVVVLINKMDTCDWCQERYQEIETKIQKFLIEIGYKSKYINFLPVSGQDGINIKDKMERKICPWFEGKSLIQQLDALKTIKRPFEAPLRVPILDRYKGDRGIQAIGKVQTGGLKVGDVVSVVPSGAVATIDAISIDDTPVQQASAGENVLLSFEKGSLSMSNIYSGCVICTMQDPCPIVSQFTANIYLHDMPPTGIMAVGYSAMFHCHNLSCPCELVEISHLVNRKNGKRSKRPPPFLRAHNTAIAKIKLFDKCALEMYNDFPHLGRFTLRDQGKTILIGKIEEIDSTLKGNSMLDFSSRMGKK